MSIWSRHWPIVRAALDLEKTRGRRSLFETNETAFLPAALEIVETPVSPTWRITAWVLMAGFALTVGWLALGKLDIVASAPGRLIPVENVKLVQPASSGIVHAILVDDGQHVRAGQPLVQLDPTISSADAEEARKALETAQLSAARDRAVLGALDGHGFRFAAPPDTPPEVAETSRALAQSRLAQIEASSAQHAADHSAAIAAMAEAQAQITKLDRTIPLLDQQVQAYDELQSKGFAPKLQTIEIHRQRVGADGDRATAVQTASKARAQAAEAASALALDRAQAKADILDDLAKNEAEARARSQELIKSSRRSGFQTLVAPVDGTVTQLAIHTVGGVVEAAKPVMVIVPSGGKLRVEAKILNRDAGFIQIGQPVAVKLDAFPFSRYGTVPGRIVGISSDAVSDNKLGLVYVARIALNRDTIDRDGETVPLMPGMTAMADIRTGRRSIASYLMSPVVERVSEAGRER
jgi:hemolysin D